MPHSLAINGTPIYLPGVLWAYRNTPHDSTGEKPSFILYGHDLRTPTEACYLPTTPSHLSDIDDYREELLVSFTSARETAAQVIQTAQQKYKRQYDKRATYTTTPLKTGNWVLVCFPQDETGAVRKLSRPWHGPYQVTSLSMSLSLKYISLRTSLSVFTGLDSNHAPRTFQLVFIGMVERGGAQVDHINGFLQYSIVWTLLLLHHHPYLAMMMTTSHRLHTCQLSQLLIISHGLFPHL